MLDFYGIEYSFEYFEGLNEAIDFHRYFEIFKLLMWVLASFQMKKNLKEKKRQTSNVGEGLIR